MLRVNYRALIFERNDEKIFCHENSMMAEMRIIFIIFVGSIDKRFLFEKLISVS
jgi:hypothetical protein